MLFLLKKVQKVTLFIILRLDKYGHRRLDEEVKEKEKWVAMIFYLFIIKEEKSMSVENNGNLLKYCRSTKATQLIHLIKIYSYHLIIQISINNFKILYNKIYKQTNIKI